MQIQMHRRSLFESELLQAVHVRARAVSAAPGGVERQDANVVVLPLAGVFAKHDGPRRHVLATPEHATLIACHTPYRISLPGVIGDECLTLRFSPDALARVAPQVMRGERFDMARFRPQVLLPARLALARSVLWRCSKSGTGDALRIEELGVGVLPGTLARDDIFFELKWAHWLQRTLPRAVRTVTVADAKLFFPEDRPQALIDPLREFLAAR